MAKKNLSFAHSCLLCRPPISQLLRICLTFWLHSRTSLFNGDITLVHTINFLTISVLSTIHKTSLAPSIKSDPSWWPSPSNTKRYFCGCRLSDNTSSMCRNSFSSCVTSASVSRAAEFLTSKRGPKRSSI